MEKTKTSQKLVECAILVAMAFILSLIKILDMPFGGSVTAASMLPIIIAGYRNGFKYGMLTGFVYSILRLIMGIGNVNYATSIIAAIAIIILDYILAFTLLGLLGLFKKNKHQTLVLVVGTICLCILRYACHVIAGCTVWVGASIPTSDGLLYSLIYNGAYMVPETVITVYVAALISNGVDLRMDKPITKIKSKNIAAVLNGVLIFGISIVIDFVMIFYTIQNEKGFNIKLISNTNWINIGIVTTVGIVAGIIVYIISKIWIKKKQSL